MENDTARLNWLQAELTKHGTINVETQEGIIDNDLRMYGQTNRRQVSFFTVTTQHTDGHDLRDAIDRARGAQ